MVILKSQNKITDFLMILACPFNFLGAEAISSQFFHNKMKYLLTLINRTENNFNWYFSISCKCNVDYVATS